MDDNTGLHLEELRRQHAAQFSVPEDKVGLVTLDLEILRKEGSFVAVHTRGLTMFETQATDWAELGIPSGSARQRQYRPPVKFLVDDVYPAWFRAAAQAARDSLKRISLAVDFMHPYQWVAFHDWHDWLEDFQKRQTAWNTYRDRHLVDEAAYQERLAWIVEQFTPSAGDAYDALKAQGAPGLGKRDDFVTKVVTRALGQLPRPEYIRQNLTLQFDLPALATPAELEEEFRRRDQIRHQREIEREQGERDLERMRLDAQIQRERDLDDARKEMFRARLARYKEQAESSSLPLEQVMGQMMQEIQGTTHDLLSSLEEHGNLRGRQGERLRGQAERVQVLQEFGQGHLLSIVKEAAGLTQPAEGETGLEMKTRLEVLATTLRQIETIVATTATAKEALRVVAEEVEVKKWRSLCLHCRRPWDSEGSLEPNICPRCSSPNIASRELGFRNPLSIE